MWILTHNDVDDNPSVWGKWEEKPSIENITKLLSDYCYEKSDITRAVDDLITYGESDMRDSSCSNFKLSKI